MATWDDVRRLALALPETAEAPSHGHTTKWTVAGKGFVWERPLRKKELAEFADRGAAAPEGPILGAQVPDLGAKEALLADNPAVYFTTPHFDGYAAVLVRLDEISPAELEELVGEAWASRAPASLRNSPDAPG